MHTSSVVIWIPQLLFFVLINFAQSSDVIRQIVNACRRLGWTKILLAQDANRRADAVDFHKYASLNNIELTAAGEVVRDVSGIPIVLYNLQSWRLLHEVIRRHLEPYSFMIHVKPEQNSEFAAFARTVDSSSAFFKIQGQKLYAVHTLANQSIFVQNEWPVSNDDSSYAEVFDMQGATITSLTLPWLPWLGLDGCDERGRDCATSGILHDLVVVLLAKQYNFTMRVDRELDGNWGVTPASGTFEAHNVTFGGVVGAVVNRRYDLALSMWNNFLERQPYVDTTFSMLAKERVAVINRMMPVLDFTLFVRPFQTVSWAGIILCSCLFAIPIYLGDLVLKDAENLPPERMTWMLAGFFFFMVQAFYGAALTMFLTNPVPPPFRDFREGLKLYPKWEMVVVEGEEMIYLSRADVDPNIARWAAQLEKDKGSVVKASLPKALDALLKPGFFLEVGKYELSDFIARNPTPFGLEIQPLGTGLREDNCLLLQRNSPFRRMFDRGIQKLRQTGVLRNVLHQYLKGLPRFDASEVQVIGISHTAIIFAGYGAVALLSVLALLAERACGGAGSLKRR